MENNEQNNQTSNVKKIKSKGGTLKYILVIIIVIMALIIGLLSGIIISGKDFSTIFNKKEITTGESNTTQKEEKKENDDKESDKTVKGENKDLKESFLVNYKTREVKNVSVGNVYYILKEEVPTITGIDSKVASKIESYLKQWYADVWKDINEQNSDEYINELLTGLNEGRKERYEIGFTQSYNVIFINNKIVTFEHIFDGSLGGVGWGNKSGVTFNLLTGEVVKMEDIVISKDEYIKACKKYVMEQLKADERYEYLNDDYEEIVNETIERMGGYLTKDGIVCLEIPKYGISNGAAGEFRYTIPYSLIKDYVDDEYVF